MSNWDLTPQPMPGVPNHSHPFLPTPQELASLANYSSFYSALAANTTFTTSLAGVLLPAPSGTTTIDPDDTVSLGTPASGRAYGDHQHAITAGTPAVLTKTSTSLESTGTGFARDLHVHSTANLPWGNVVTRQKITTASAVSGSPFTTDFTLTFTADVTRLYKIRIETDVTFGAATVPDNVTVWIWELLVGGVFDHRLQTYGVHRTQLVQPHVSITSLWEPTAGSKVLTVRMTRTSGVGDVRLDGGGSGQSRWFWVEDIGPR